MIYTDYAKKAIENTIIIDEDNGIVFLNPHYKTILEEIGLNDASIISDHKVSNEDIWEMLKLKVEQINAIMGAKKNAVIDWLNDLIIGFADPAKDELDNKLITDMMNYMQMSDKMNDKERELENKEKNLDVKTETAKIAPFGLNFAKKKK